MSDILCSLCLLLKLQSNKIRFCFVAHLRFRALCSDNNGKIHRTRWDKANQLNGDRLVVDDDITSLHYRAIDRRIPMVEKVVDWSRASLTRCRQWRPPIIIMMPHNTKATQHLFALMGVATQLKPIWLLRLRHRVQLYQHYQPSEELR